MIGTINTETLSFTYRFPKSTTAIKLVLKLFEDVAAYMEKLWEASQTMTFHLAEGRLHLDNNLLKG